MITFKQHIDEAKRALPQPQPLQQKSFQDVAAALGKGKINAMLKHKWFTDYNHWEKAYKHGVTPTQFHEVEVYPYMTSVHKTDDNKIRPTTMLRFHFSDSGRINQIHKFIRNKEPSSEEKRDPGTGWRYVKSWKNDKGDE